MGIQKANLDAINKICGEIFLKGGFQDYALMAYSRDCPLMNDQWGSEKKGKHIVSDILY